MDAFFKRCWYFLKVKSKKSPEIQPDDVEESMIASATPLPLSYSPRPAVPEEFTTWQRIMVVSSSASPPPPPSTPPAVHSATPRPVPSLPRIPSLKFKTPGAEKWQVLARVPQPVY